MANTYTKAAFTLTMSHADASLLRVAEQAVDILDTNGDDADLAREYDALDPAFHAVFPARDAMKFGSLLEIFDDPHFPFLDCAIDIDWEGPDGNARVTFSGDQFGIEQVATLIFRACKSAVPCGFSWISDCDKLRPGEFTGGCVVITGAGLTFHSTQEILDRAARTIAADDTTAIMDCRHGFALASRDRDGHAIFWNSDDGFGALATATVFSEREAREYDPVIADDEPEWMALPAPLAA